MDKEHHTFSDMTTKISYSEVKVELISHYKPIKV